MSQLKLPWSIAPSIDPRDLPSLAAGSELRQNKPAPLPGAHDPPSFYGTDPPLLFVRHPRARRYTIRLVDGGVVRVTIPRWGSKREAQAFAERERGWIAKQWQRWLNEREASPQEHDDPRVRDARDRDSRDRARRELPERLMALASKHGLADRVTKVSIRNQKWRWGSCSPNGHICLNWRLVAMPEAVRDYVLIHELMHLRRMDHSARFWKLVAQACPEYREHRRFLRAQRT